MIRFTFLCVITISAPTLCLGANILAYFPIPAFSHQLVYQPIWRELALRGHNVTVLTSHPLNNMSIATLTEFDLSSSRPLFEVQHKMANDISITSLYMILYEILREIFDHQMTTINATAILQSVKNVDLIITEACHPTAYAFAAHYRAPLVVVSSLDLYPQVHRAAGSAFAHPVVYPNLLAKHIYQNLNIVERIKNVAFEIWFRVWYHYWVLPEALHTARKHFPQLHDNALAEAENNISLLIQNVNIGMHGSRTYGSFIQIEFTHIKSPAMLPEDLQSILDSAPNGIVYLSMGSNIKSANLPAATLTKLLNVFKKLPYVVLWKWETHQTDDFPKNVLTRKWLPQQDVLRHPNVRAFVTQGGLQSIEEAIYFTVPIVGFPFMADQPMNVQKIEYLEAGIHINPYNFDEDQLYDAILKVAENQTYRNKMSELRSICLDQPMSGLERAIWWIEYVIRHKGARHLRTPLDDVPIYKYLMLDILIVLVLTLIAVIIMSQFLIRIVLQIFGCDNIQKYKRQ